MYLSAIITGSDDLAYFQDEKITFLSGDAQFEDLKLKFSRHQECKRYLFVEFPPGYEGDMSQAERHQLCICLSGRVKILTSGGSEREFASGDAFMMKDTQVGGHAVQVVGEETCRWIVIQLT